MKTFISFVSLLATVLLLSINFINNDMLAIRLILSIIGIILINIFIDMNSKRGNK